MEKERKKFKLRITSIELREITGERRKEEKREAYSVKKIYINEKLVIKSSQ